MSDSPDRRAPDTADLRALAAALADCGVEYAVIGGIAMALHGFPRATMDIDLILPVVPENNRRLLSALARIPETQTIVRELKQEWLDQGFSTAAEGQIIIDLLYVAAGHKFDELRPHLQTVRFDGVPVTTLDLDGLLMTKETTRDSDAPDRARLKRLRDAVREVRDSPNTPTSPPALSD